MTIFLSIASLTVGFLFLIKGADWLVEGASTLAARLGISPLMIGLTVVAFGTSAPELIVNTIASWQGETELAIANVLGSNLANLLLILGVSAIITPLVVKRQTVKKEIPFSIIAAIIVFIVANDTLINGVGPDTISRIDGLLMLILFFSFMYVSFSGNNSSEVEIPKNGHSLLKGHSLSLIGLACLFAGGKLVIDSALDISAIFGLSESFVGVTIVAIGTSLPELAASAMAAYRKQNDIAIGNVIGSNIFNALWVLGVSALITPLNFTMDSNILVLIVIAVTALMIFFLKWSRQHQIERWHGITFVMLYIIFIYFTALAQ